MPIFAWNVPLVSLIFLKRSLVFPILLFADHSMFFLEASRTWGGGVICWRWLPQLTTLCLPLFLILHWMRSGGKFKSGHGANIYTMAISNHYKQGLFFCSQKWLASIYQHVTGNEQGWWEGMQETKRSLSQLKMNHNSSLKERWFENAASNCGKSKSIWIRQVCLGLDPSFTTYQLVSLGTLSFNLICMKRRWQWYLCLQRVRLKAALLSLSCLPLYVPYNLERT